MDRDLWTLLAGYLLLVNLAGFLLMGLEMTIEEMTEMGNPVHHATIEARDALKG